MGGFVEIFKCAATAPYHLEYAKPTEDFEGDGADDC
jgi:hypothetical protein